MTHAYPIRLAKKVNKHIINTRGTITDLVSSTATNWIPKNLINLAKNIFKILKKQKSNK